VIPARTLKHRKARKEHLTAGESDKPARLIRIFDQPQACLAIRKRHCTA